MDFLSFFSEHNFKKNVLLGKKIHKLQKDVYNTFLIFKPLTRPIKNICYNLFKSFAQNLQMLIQGGASLISQLFLV